MHSPSRETLAIEERALARAFASFTEAAGSLERSYGHLQKEVARLRRELEASNLELSRSLESNRQMHVRLHRILEALPCGVLVSDSNGRISIANAETQRQTGLTPEMPLPEWLKQLVQDGANGLEIERVHAEEIAWTSVRLARLSDEAGGSSIFILQDITAAKKLQEEQDRLRHRQALVELSATLAHEIRNPLGSLELFAGLLADAGLDSTASGWVEHLQVGLRTLAATVNNVLQYHSQPQLAMAPIDIGSMLSSLSTFLGPLAQQSKICVKVGHQLAGVDISADRHRLQQVFFNLALNAFRFMPHGGVFEIVGGITPQGGVRVELRDSGEGIASENISRIFTPGFTTRPGSPGLGLAVCKTIIEQHRGTIDVQSKAGQGTTFTLEFPLAGDNP